MLISESYRCLNRRMHEERSDYGVSGQRYVGRVRKLSRALSSTDILDYGCGKRTLQTALGFPIRNYDPCIAGLEAPPEPARLVVCTDVLEHVEPECLEAVLDDLRRCTLETGFFVVCTRPSKKRLADGRTAHLILKGARWWLDRLWERFRVMDFRDIDDDVHVVVRHRDRSP